MLAEFEERANAGQVVEVSEIKRRYKELVDHPIGNSDICLFIYLFYHICATSASARWSLNIPDYYQCYNGSNDNTDAYENKENQIKTTAAADELDHRFIRPDGGDPIKLRVRYIFLRTV